MRAVAAAFTPPPLSQRITRISTVSAVHLHQCRAAHRWRPAQCRGKPAVSGVAEDDEEDTSREALNLEEKEEESAGAGSWGLGWFRLDEVGMDILGIAVPAVLALAADPVTALVDTAFVGHIGSVELAAVGVSISVFNLVSKLFNVPLLNVTTSFVAEQQAVDAKYSGVGESNRRWSVEYPRAG
ncbi:unnamed protein product [Triticum turgidum subsp. durum]|uniref:Protein DETOXIFICATION n=1 Tax=Triticum turgidum subsp. durum TaxID=4567 RepID=A0A9R0VZ17_TRITD|nr:unnamed protein product [Triticum turgidum subsp. durum]